VIKLQHAFITFLTGADSMISIVILNLQFLYSTAEESKIGALRTLREQYQRMMQSQPLQRPLRDTSRIDSDLVLKEILPYSAHTFPGGEQVDGTLDIRTSSKPSISSTPGNKADPNIADKEAIFTPAEALTLVRFTETEVGVMCWDRRLGNVPCCPEW
jgi:hypothetical protein